MYAPTQQERGLATLCHIGGLVGTLAPPANIIVPLAIWWVKKGQSAFVNEHGKEAINFQINLSAWLLICYVGIVVLAFAVLVSMGGVGSGNNLMLILFVWRRVLQVIALILGIVAGVKAYKGNPYRYPFIIRLMK